jgi:hypothetical protein
MAPYRTNGKGCQAAGTAKPAWRVRSLCVGSGIGNRRSFMPGSLAGSILVAAALAFAVSACSSIGTLTATPDYACVGSPVDVHWEAKGRVKLTSEPALDGTGSQKKKGTRRFTVATRTRFVLEARGLFGAPKTAEADVDVAPGDLTRTAVAVCDEAARVLTTTLDVSAEVSGAFLVASVVNTQERSIAVAREGRRAQLAPHGSSAVFAGVPLQGAWQVSSPLAPGESCVSALRGIRQKLQVKFLLQCGPSA